MSGLSLICYGYGLKAFLYGGQVDHLCGGVLDLSLDCGRSMSVTDYWLGVTGPIRIDAVRRLAGTHAVYVFGYRTHVEVGNWIYRRIMVMFCYDSCGGDNLLSATGY